MALEDVPLAALIGGAYGLISASVFAWLALSGDPDFQKAPLEEQAEAVLLPGAIYGGLAAAASASLGAFLPEGTLEAYRY